MRSLKCLRCGGTMRFGLRQKFQMGQHSALFGDWPHILAGALELEVYFCPDCGKAEFFVPETGRQRLEREQSEEFDFIESMVNQDIDAVSDDGMPQKKCPSCGTIHDFDYPKCPYCGHDYYAK